MKSTLYWIIALIVTLASAYYQRVSGPTYPESGSSGDISYTFARSHSGQTDQPVEINIPEGTESYLHWKRYKTDDEWAVLKMENKEGKASAYLPAQPPAGKLEYYVTVNSGAVTKRFPEDHNVVTRFKGEVPAGIIIPHVILIFLAMLFSLRTGIEALKKGSNLVPLTIVTLILTFMGGMVFGPITQYYAFGDFWTGIPFGFDLTDNKTLIALIGWIIAGYAVYKNRRPRLWIVIAAALMFIIFLIPHSLLGSELDYSKMQN